MRISDAHFHLDLKKENPVADMLAIMQKNELSEIVLILNSREESEVFMEQFDLVATCVERIHVAVLFDLRDKAFFEKTAAFLSAQKVPYSVKLHSRISKTTVEELPAICEALKEYEFAHIIVDAFFYGSNLENQIGVETAIYLAKKFTEKKVILAHFGGVKILETMLYTRDVPNIYYDISCSVCYFEQASIWQDVYHCTRVNRDKVMFGSDHPDFTVEYAVGAANRLFERFGEPESELYGKVMRENLKKIYFSK